MSVNSGIRANSHQAQWLRHCYRIFKCWKLFRSVIKWHAKCKKLFLFLLLSF